MFGQASKADVQRRLNEEDVSRRARVIVVSCAGVVKLALRRPCGRRMTKEPRHRYWRHPRKVRHALQMLECRGVSTRCSMSDQPREHGQSDEVVAFRAHVCDSTACKCRSEEEYCGEFCKSVETSSDDLKCGCGHMACDITKQLGNESTFDATGS